MRLRVTALVLGLAAATPAWTQDTSETAEIVVTARRSGAPMWEVTAGDSIVLLVGEINDVPKATPWHPDRLEAAAIGADRVILGTRAKVSVGDVFRLLFKGGKLKKLPEGRTTADYLSPPQQQHLVQLEQRFGESWAGQSMLLTAFELLTKELRFNRDTTDNATEVVRDAARKAQVPAQPVGEVRGEDLIDSLFSAPPEAHIPCLDVAMTAVEDGSEGVLRRGRAWTQFDVPGVMASPIETALGRCWPWTDGRFGPELRRQWSDAVSEALKQPGVTLAVVPLRVLAERGGVLDQLDARQIDIVGPAWRAEAPDQGSPAQ